MKRNFIGPLTAREQSFKDTERAVWLKARIRARKEGRKLTKDEKASVLQEIRNAWAGKVPMRALPKAPKELKAPYFKRIEKVYGLSQPEFLRMFQAQDNCCRICKKELVLLSKGAHAPVVDHCHRTGKVRSILCHGCNVRVGRVEFDAEKALYEAARSYVDEHTEEG